MYIDTTDGSGPDSTALYRLSGIAKTYGTGAAEVRALAEFDLEVAAGEFVVVAGPSGSGKSTLLQLLGALDRPTGGGIEFEGHDLTRMGSEQLAELRLNTLGFIFQQFNLIPTLSARENVEVAMAPTTLAPAQRAERARDLLAQVGLSERGEHLPSQLSGGEQQRVAIARALANEPDVLLADEPTGNLDTATGESILSLLYRLWKERALTIVLITHDTAIAQTAPRVIRMADGRIAEELRNAGTPMGPTAVEAGSR